MEVNIWEVVASAVDMPIPAIPQTCTSRNKRDRGEPLVQDQILGPESGGGFSTTGNVFDSMALGVHFLRYTVCPQIEGA